ncbi:SAF domain-containing protein [Amycolatopsis echigonensis]|uniref:SAF domain-containing protein n=1 Tax=Amycolatopsis echigonensis TaxID=2576905 RepID=UPI001C80D6F8|nr:SAF domain-containing protein [Amycolatopsis echigonensis]
MIACAAAAVIVSIQLDNRQPVLVLARPVTVGHLLSAPDFRQVSVSADVGLDAVPAAESSTVVGRPAAFSLPAGTLLTRGSLGPPAIPVDGQAIAAVALKAGQFPPALAPGARVAVLVSSGSASTGTASSNPGQVAVPIAQWTATVSDVGAGPDPQSTVVSLQLPEANARQLAAAPAGQVSLVALSGGGG